MLVYKRVLVIVLFCVTASLHAETTTQVWSSVFINSSFNDNFLWQLEGQGWFSDNASRLSQAFVKPGVGYRVTEHSSTWFGYGRFMITQPYAPRTVYENRLWQQLLWAKNYSRYRVTARARLEERFIKDFSTGLRARGLLQFKRPIMTKDNVLLIVNDEVFYNFNDFNDNQSHGFDQNRAYLGLGFKATEHYIFGVGYLHHWIRRVKIDNFTGHTLMLSLSWS
jgi:hypothetical protein